MEGRFNPEGRVPKRAREEEDRKEDQEEEIGGEDAPRSFDELMRDLPREMSEKPLVEVMKGLPLDQLIDLNEKSRDSYWRQRALREIRERLEEEELTLETAAFPMMLRGNPSWRYFMQYADFSTQVKVLILREKCNREGRGWFERCIPREAREKWKQRFRVTDEQIDRELSAYASNFNQLWRSAITIPTWGSCWSLPAEPSDDEDESTVVFFPRITLASDRARFPRTREIFAKQFPKIGLRYPMNNDGDEIVRLGLFKNVETAIQAARASDLAWGFANTGPAKYRIFMATKELQKKDAADLRAWLRDEPTDQSLDQILVKASSLVIHQVI